MSTGTFNRSNCIDTSNNVQSEAKKERKKKRITNTQLKDGETRPQEKLSISDDHIQVENNDNIDAADADSYSSSTSEDVDTTVNMATNIDSDVALLGPYDVICGRDKAAFNTIGNRRFRYTIALTLARFLDAKSRKEKSIVSKSVVTLVEQNGGRFLVRQGGSIANTNTDVSTASLSTNLNSRNNSIWVELNSKQKRLKVGHALRDAERKSLKRRTKRHVKKSSSPSTHVTSKAGYALTSDQDNDQEFTKFLPHNNVEPHLQQPVSTSLALVQDNSKSIADNSNNESSDYNDATITAQQNELYGFAIDTTIATISNHPNHLPQLQQPFLQTESLQNREYETWDLGAEIDDDAGTISTISLVGDSSG